MKAAFALLLCYHLMTSSGSDEIRIFDYYNQQQWTDLCNEPSVTDQSPINIIPSEVSEDHTDCASTFDWDIDTEKDYFQVFNNGHSVKLTAVAREQCGIDGDIEDHDGFEYIKLNQNYNTIAKFPNYFKWIKPDGSAEHEYFCLDSIHFHWGLLNTMGSEHRINWVQSTLEAHFVHYSCDHTSLASTMEQFETISVEQRKENGEDIHQLAVVTVLFDVDDNKNNPAFDAIFKHDGDVQSHIQFPGYDHGNIKKTDIINGLYLLDLIPNEYIYDGYYAYEGSLTTPPCTNIVRWHVMNARGYIGTSQMAYFRGLHSATYFTIAPNYRDVQQNNPNTVYWCIDPYYYSPAHAGSKRTHRSSMITETEETNEVPVWEVSIISSIVTAFVLGLIFAFVYWKQRKKIQKLNNERWSEINKEDPDLETNSVGDNTTM